MAASPSIEEQKAQQKKAYLEHFNADDYMKTYCIGTTPYFRQLQGFLHTVFALEVTSGESLLDVGTGPSPFKIISASKIFKNIVVANNLESNRNSLLKWLQAEADCHDYSALFKTTAALEYNKNYLELEDRVRKSVKEVIPCNMHLANPIAPDQRKFDVIVSSYVLESAAPSLELYRQSLANMSSLLNPGGKLVINGALEYSYYCIGDSKVPVPYMTKDIVNQALVDAGLQPSLWVLLPMVLREVTTDCRLFYLVIATKPID